jgi:hypothetical protein
MVVTGPCDDDPFHEPAIACHAASSFNTHAEPTCDGGSLRAELEASLSQDWPFTRGLSAWVY